MARFLREQFMNTSEDCDWLRSTALKGLIVPPFNSFTLAGNEDAPARVDLYRDKTPAYNHQPVAVFCTSMETGDLVHA